MNKGNIMWISGFNETLHLQYVKLFVLLWQCCGIEVTGLVLCKKYGVSAASIKISYIEGLHHIDLDSYPVNF